MPRACCPTAPGSWPASLLARAAARTSISPCTTAWPTTGADASISISECTPRHPTSSSWLNARCSGVLRSRFAAAKAAAVALAEHFMARGLPGVALERLRKIAAAEPLGADNLDLYYAIADACENTGDYAGARDVLQKVVAENHAFRDAVGRLEKVEKLAESSRERQAMAMPSVVRGGLSEGERYEFLQKLGAGGMGIVHKAYDKLLNRVVAYKMLMDQYMEIEEVKERFLREARSASTTPTS